MLQLKSFNLFYHFTFNAWTSSDAVSNRIWQWHELLQPFQDV